MSHRDRYLAVLVRLLPSSFRDRHEAAMQEQLWEMKSELGTRPGRWRTFRLYAGLSWDVLRRVWAEHRRARRQQWTPTAGGLMVRWIDDLKQDLRIALRALRRAPTFTAVAVFTLGIGIGANASIFSAVSGILLRPLPYPDSDRLVMIFNRFPNLGIDRNAQNPGDFVDYTRHTDAFEEIAAFGGTHTQTLTGVGPAARVSISSATDSFFSLLGVRPVVGRLFQPDDDETSVVLSHGFWQTRFGGVSDVVGHTFQLNGNTRTVIGVLPPDFLLHMPAHLNVPTNVAVWNPIRLYLGTNDNPDRTAHWMSVVAKLAPGVTIEQAQSQLDRVAEWQRANFAVRAERDARIDIVAMHDEIVREVRPTLVALFGAVGFVLLIACANLANLLLARSQLRRRELAVRAALGGSRFRLVRHLLTESAVLATLGGTLGIALAYVGVEIIHALRPSDLPFVANVEVNRAVLTFVFVAAIGSTALFGLIPAVTASRNNLAEFVGTRDSSGGGKQASRLKSGLIVLEVALSMILLVGSGLMMRSFAELGNVRPGYRTDNVLTFVAGLPDEAFRGPRLPNGLRLPYQNFFERGREALEALPGVEAVAAIWPVPLSNSSEGFSTYTDREDAGDEQSQLASSQLITPGYFETMRIPIVAGRSFNLEDGGDKLVIDETMAEKMWPGENPIGKRLKIGWWSGPVWGEVVGVAASVRTLDLRKDDPETVYRKAAVYAYSAPAFMVRTANDPLALAETVREAVQGLHSSVAIERMRTLSSYQDEQLAPTRFVMTLIAIFAGIALLFSAVGLYGVISYLVSQRTREIGIRLAFGARRSHVFRLVMRQGLMLAALGVALGLIGALATTRLLTSYLFGVEPTDPATLALIVILLGIVTAAACARPAVRATRVDPARSLVAE